MSSYAMKSAAKAATSKNGDLAATEQKTLAKTWNSVVAFGALCRSFTTKPTNRCP